ncbi:hypothetical protein AN1V17_49350 [Vallitalea sediminicola]
MKYRLIIIIVVLSITGCNAPMKENNESEVEISKLKDQIVKMESEIKTLEDENLLLKKEITSYEEIKNSQIHEENGVIFLYSEHIGSAFSIGELQYQLNGNYIRYNYKITASSELKSDKGDIYSINNIDDYDSSTTWVEGAEGYGIGESINYTFEILDYDWSIGFIEIYNGYRKSPSLYRENGKVRKLELYKNDNLYAILNIDDSMDLQIFYPNIKVETNEELKLTFRISEIYEGVTDDFQEGYEDTCITDIIMGSGI